ncbi:MAG: BamA/TamA family outer membrane protein [Deltaproteobacteria bacterium]|nr:BamA/TamA family outer membrane protein [Deltaproteobacteria bacterium]
MIGLVSTLILSATLPEVTGDALSPYRGQPVLAVDVWAPPEEDAESLRELIDIQPGFLLASDDIRAAIKRLYALGRFSDVGVTAERLSGTVSLHFYLRLIRRLESLELVGVESSDHAALRAALRIEVGDEVDSRTPTTLQTRATEYLRRAGFANATAKVELRAAGSATAMAATVHVNEGRPTRVRRVRFFGRPRLERAVLARLVGTRPGGVLDQNQLEADVRELLAQYRRRGFFDARVKPAAVSIDRRGADVSFVIDAGFRVSVTISGNRILSRDSLLALWPDLADTLRPADLQLFADRITDSYRRLGYFAAKVAARQTPIPATLSIDCQVRVDEGPLYRVTDLSFRGARAFKPELLRAQVQAHLAAVLKDDSLIEPLSTTDTCLQSRIHLGAGGVCPLTTVPPEWRYVPEVYEQALEEIAAAYRNLGFLAVVVGPLQATIEGQEVRVLVPIFEGPQTFVAALSFGGNEALDAARLLDDVERGSASVEGAIPIRPGAPLAAAGVEDGRIAILRHYRDQGYLYAQVTADTVIAADANQAAVAYHVDEGPQVRIQRVIIRGNHFTRDGIIRSRITLAPDEVYRLDQALRDQRSIAALGVFANVRVKLIDEERPSERKDVVAEVTEKNRQPVELGGGLSSAYGARIDASYSHINLFGTAAAFTGSVRANHKLFFDLYGRFAETMRERYREFTPLERVEREVRTGVRSPPLVSLPLDPALRLDLVHERENAIPYSLSSYTAILGFDFVGAYGFALSVEPQISLSDLQCVVAADVGGGCSAEARTRRIDVGGRQAFKIGPSLSLDRRDNPFNPHRGFFAAAKAIQVVGQQQTGAAAPFAFARLEGSLSAYVPVGRATLALSARAGRNVVSKGRVPLDERFFLGGRSTLRGFVEGGALIAEDACVVGSGAAVPAGCHEAITRPTAGPPLTTGGDVMLLFKTELRLPVTETLSFGLFVDAGNLWVATPSRANLRARVGTGAGLRYATPVGPLALDIGVNTSPRAANAEPSRPQPHFTVGVF